jgi:hypothetical protein
MNFGIELAINNCALKFYNNVEILFGKTPTGKTSFNFELGLLLNGSFAYGYAVLPRVYSAGGVIPEGYGSSKNDISPIVSEGSSAGYIPPEPEYGFAFIPYIVSWGLLKTSAGGDGDTDLPAILSKGGLAGFGEAAAMLNSLISVGQEGYSSHVAYAVEGCFLFSGIHLVQDYVIFLNSSGDITGTISGSRELVAQFITNLQVEGTFTSLQDYVESVLEELHLSSSFMQLLNTDIGVDPSARVWVVNTETGASSQYDKYGFNSFFERDGEYFGIASDGIYKLDGADDAGNDIDFELEVGNSNYGTYKTKRSPRVYVGYRSTGEMLLKVECDGVENIYTAEENTSDLRSHKFRLSERGPGTTGSFWNYKLLNVEGCQVDVSNVEFSLLIKSRRIK